MCRLSYRYVSFEDIRLLCMQGVLDWNYWFLSTDDNMLVLFYDTQIIGALELSCKFGALFIEMMEIPYSSRKMGYGTMIVQFLQNCCNSIGCVPIEESERLFVKCGFVHSEGAL